MILTIYLKLFGEWEILVDGKKIEKITSQKALKLLFFMYLTKRKMISMDEIAETFWNGYNREYVRKNVNVQLYYIRKDLQIEPRYLSSKRDYIFIERSIFSSDYDLFLELVEQNNSIDDLKGIYTGELLESFDEKWIINYRRWIKTLYEKKKEIEAHGIDQYAIEKVKAAFELQKNLREEIFVSIMIDDEEFQEILKSVSVRRGDVVLNVQNGTLLLLEKTNKPSEEIIEGFSRRTNIPHEKINLISENRLLGIINGVTHSNLEKADKPEVEKGDDGR